MEICFSQKGLQIYIPPHTGQAEGANPILKIGLEGL